MTTLALPFTRSRRRRWKPPRPEFWTALFFVLWCIGFGVYDLLCAIDFLSSGNSVEIISGVFNVLLGVWMLWALNFWWRRFMYEWHLWRRDD